MARKHPHTFQYDWDEVPFQVLAGLASPVLGPRTAYLGIYDLYHGTNRLDRHQTAVYTSAWAAASVATYFASGGTWLSGGQAFRTAAYLSTGPAFYAAMGLAAVPSTLFVANKKLIESAPVEQRESMWQMFAQALTGTGPGVGNADMGF